ncbi:MAG: hypothetical protein K1X83_04470 [Oligoflexia bacterium]|nr:hypothetical protein [Oligoflexia bacterium]
MKARELQKDWLNRSANSVFVRGLEGEIKAWNTAAERRYGWAAEQAVGNVSHLLLSTVFPDPLPEINQQLLERGYWEGELIHTLSNGRRVKVWSRWELNPERGASSDVIETNIPLGQIAPESAYLKSPTGDLRALRRRIIRTLLWWTAPALMLLAAFAVVAFLTSSLPLAHLGH